MGVCLINLQQREESDNNDNVHIHNNIKYYKRTYFESDSDESGDNNNNNFGNIGIEYALGNNVLSLDYTQGHTNINTTNNSIIKNFSNVDQDGGGDGSCVEGGAGE